MISFETSEKVRLLFSECRVPIYRRSPAVWADHANSISIAYSGTGALKTDFIRTGKRTRKGLVEDGWNSVMRYLKNNFFDGARQVSAFQAVCPRLETDLLQKNRMRLT